MEDVEEVLRRLNDEPPIPSIVDIGRAMTDGRRRARIRAAAGSSGVVLAVVMAVAGTSAVVRAGRPHPARPVMAAASSASATRPASPAEPTRCAVEVLPAPKDYAGIVTMGMDPTGRYQVGRGVGPDGRYHPLLWTDGVLTELDRRGTDAEVDGIVVNASGVVVWTSATIAGESGRDERTWRRQDGRITEVTAAKGAVVRAITPAGVVYAVDVAPGTPDGPFASLPSRLLTIPVDGPPSVRQFAGPGGLGHVDVDGTVLIVVPKESDGSLTWTSSLWLPDGSTRPVPAVQGASSNTLVNDLNNGWVVGHGFTGPIPMGDKGSTTRPERPGMIYARWNMTVGTQQTFPDLKDVQGVNRYGWFGGQNRAGRPVLVLGRRTLVLPTPRNAQFDAGTFATTVSDDGRVVGGQVSLPDTVAAVRWRCS
jgi:hypothetical protein